YLVENSETKQVGVCLDTQHTFAAGYPIHKPEGIKTFFTDFKKLVGLKHLHAFHLNDSMVEFNSYKDRHEHIGQGFIGKEGMTTILNNEIVKKYPLILETPMENGSHKNDLKRAKDLIKK
ncbi:MAG: TIM barrel protein, partial [Candidatus Diapherotrites archaeon]|nr:TIM barrel protein [Candidatus Diapherotrites archaeon]